MQKLTKEMLFCALRSTKDRVVGGAQRIITSPLRKQFQESRGERPMEKVRESKGRGMAKVTVVFRSWVVKSWEQKPVEEVGEGKGLWFHFSRINMILFKHEEGGTIRREEANEGGQRGDRLWLVRSAG